MMCICRRCQRLAAAMDDDLFHHVDDDVADVVDAAFRVAQAHGAAEIGFEHLLHAMTSLGRGQMWLKQSSVDADRLREEAAHVMGQLEQLDLKWSEAISHTLVLQDDVAAALAFAVDDAFARGADEAQLGDLLAVLMGYRPSDQRLFGLFEILQNVVIAGEPRGVQYADAWAFENSVYERAEHAGSEHLGSENVGPKLDWAKFNVGVTSLDASEAKPLGREFGTQLSALDVRLAGLEARSEEDHQRIATALQELSRQRERLPMADDWRSQMQSLVTEFDALRRRVGDIAISVADADRAQVRPAADHVRETRITGLSDNLDRLVRDVERLSLIVARLERVDCSKEARSANVVLKQSGVPSDLDGDGSRQNAATTRVVATTGAASSAVAASAAAASAAAMLGMYSGWASRSAGEQAQPKSSVAVLDAATSDAATEAEKSRSNLTTSDQPSRVRKKRRTSRNNRARARKRTSIKISAMSFARVVRLGLRGRVKRRERSWWRWLSNRERWRAVRQRGGRFRAFGERFNHRGGTSNRGAQSNSRLRNASNDGHRQGKRFYLSMDDDIVDAPSIGPKTAERLRPARIFTVRDLLKADAEAVAGAVSARHITAQAVRDWQDQARLVIMVPFLRGTHAQLLVGAGFRNYEDLALADQATLMSSLLRFATTREGQSILRNGPPPDLEKVIKWMEHALESEPARAA